MKCPNCSNQMEEIEDEIMDEKYKRWYCKNCDTFFVLISEEYLKHLEKESKSILTDREFLEDVAKFADEYEKELKRRASKVGDPFIGK